MLQNFVFLYSRPVMKMNNGLPLWKLNFFRIEYLIFLGGFKYWLVPWMRTRLYILGILECSNQTLAFLGHFWYWHHPNCFWTLIIESVEDFNFRLNIQTEIQLQPLIVNGTFTDKSNFLRFLLVSNTFPGFPTLGEQNCLL